MHVKQSTYWAKSEIDVLKFRMYRTAGLLCIFAASAVLLACQGGGEQDADAAEASPKKFGGTLTTDSPADSITVVFQMTGLLLIVPPTDSLPKTHIIFPRVSGHTARLGFGADSSALCVRFRDGVCYVDLKTWNVQPIGAGGAATNFGDIGLPPDVPNVSRGSGSEYRANISRIQPLIRRQVVFETGGIAGRPCALAQWSYRPVNALGQPQTAETLSIPNVLNWVIRFPADRPFTLAFQQGNDVPIAVPLRAVTNDSILVVLAHVPDVEADSLPPATPGPATGTPPARVTHFHDFYNLLRKPGQSASPPGTHRPLPQSPTPIEPSLCPVRVTTFAQDTVTGGGHRTEGGGIKTYGCVVGSADG